ncbi:TPA: hypothetical protein I8627_001664 [Citrobacter freundii]|uniref:DUF6056 family protein n=1 Tax=Citrobacter freundii TaxID=546 RepID=UPI001A289B34|nr:hypothetical protein [Citrobacter freundii]HAT3768833.1 hypothetical protein [Citrobacter freundii]
MKNIAMYSAIPVIFLLVLFPSLHIPLHSDDFFYKMIGASPSAQIDHYIHWSGRIITNIISGILLNLPRFAYSAINAMALTILIVLIRKIPTPFSDGNENSISKESLFYFVLFFLYWISNPNLGQTSFWIVGSANYLWTNVFIAEYYFYLFSIIKKERYSKVAISCCLLLAFLAGCSNENTSIVTILLSIAIYVIYRKNIILAGIVGNVIGASVLLLSPGTAERASHYTYWNNIGIFQKAELHFLDRFPTAVSGYWQVYVVFIVFLMFICLSHRPNRELVTLSILFFIGSFLANAAFIGSPVLPPRSMNGGLCLLLISLSLLIGSCYADKRQYFSGMIVSTLFCLAYFVVSYFLFAKSMQRADDQDAIRNEIIHNEKAKGKDVIYIPEYYFGRLAKYNDRFDLYHAKAMDRYYSVKEIKTFPVGFDYARINTREYVTPSTNEWDGISAIKFIYYCENFCNDKFFISEINKDIHQKDYKDTSFYVRLIEENGKQDYLMDLKLNTTIINGRFFIWAKLGGVNLKKIDTIKYGFRNVNTKQDYSINSVSVN